MNVDILAELCAFTQEYISYLSDENDKRMAEQLVSWQIACFISNYTKDGIEGVDPGVVLEYSWTKYLSKDEWKEKMKELVNYYGGFV
jgi:hypothetical protein